ncbi:rep [Macaca mulatta feces associated virus 4]|uniref:Rep n=1 Tax=Macaca mulatta feces associated virus 4 TaxID=2499226 RepID=A0A1W5PX76_9VIRU|nr:rep [Macaca mulatta feces associated virus 4]APG55823.1 rep [Macaca mulatta feces associated virus 4]
MRRIRETMGKTYMLTIPRNDTYREGNRIFAWFRKNDIHKWVLGAEKGSGGYEHWQMRVQCRFGFEELKVLFPTAHIEECSDKWTYEAKEGVYWRSNDRRENIQQRFGKLRYAQKRVIERADGTNDREVVVWYDQEGKAGKSWLTGAMWERGLAYFSVADTSGKTIVMDIASEYLKNGWRPYIIIDIPRAGKWTPELYEAIERIKDGLIKDPRYSSEAVNIHGVKVIVMTNTMPKLDKLSADRWKIITQEELTLEETAIEQFALTGKGGYRPPLTPPTWDSRDVRGPLS